MDIIQPISKYFFEPLVAIRENSSHLKYIREFEKTQYLSKEAIYQRQLEKLQRLLIHAEKNSPFYKKRFTEVGFKPEAISDIKDIQNIPLLVKSDIQKHKDEMRAINYPDSKIISNQTGGSTGSPLQFYLDRERLFSRKASTIRHDRWTGWDIGHKVGVLWGNRVDLNSEPGMKAKLRKILSDRRLILDTSSITSEKMKGFIQALKRYKPVIYVAYANSVYLFARYIKENDIHSYHRPRGIITSAELLLDKQRVLIEEVFGCPVYDRYGCRETSIIASECSYHSGLHINAETLLVEFLHNDRPCHDGEPGKIVLTDLLNYGMPFIRYRIEDVGMPLLKECKCGRGLPLMKMAGGRITDFIVTPEGKIVSGASMTIYFIAETEGIAQAQLVQKRKDFLLLRLVKDDKFNDITLKNIRAKVSEFFGRKMKYDIEFTENIPIEDSGKYRFSVSEIDPMEFL